LFICRSVVAEVTRGGQGKRGPRRNSVNPDEATGIECYLIARADQEERRVAKSSRWQRNCAVNQSKTGWVMKKGKMSRN